MEAHAWAVAASIIVYGAACYVLGYARCTLKNLKREQLVQKEVAAIKRNLANVRALLDSMRQQQEQEQ